MRPAALPPIAGGCFWGLELAYQRLPGVVKTSVGYTAGHTPNPTYEEVCSGRTGHTEAVQVRRGRAAQGLHRGWRLLDMLAASARGAAWRGRHLGHRRAVTLVQQRQGLAGFR